MFTSSNLPRQVLPLLLLPHLRLSGRLDVTETLDCPLAVIITTTTMEIHP